MLDIIIYKWSPSNNFYVMLWYFKCYSRVFSNQSTFRTNHVEVLLQLLFISLTAKNPPFYFWQFKFCLTKDMFFLGGTIGTTWIKRICAIKPKWKNNAFKLTIFKFKLISRDNIIRQFHKRKLYYFSVPDACSLINYQSNFHAYL